jgi:Mn2+/Fe2+ NRAMP family transporter
MIVGVLIGFFGTLITNQDGWSRLFANGTLLIFKGKIRGIFSQEKFLKNGYLLIVLTVIPIAIYSMTGDPVRLLQISGTIEILLIPVIAVFVLMMNRKFLPEKLQPGKFKVALVIAATLCFTTCIALYLSQQVRNP